jgi:hypothetical protein
MAKKPRERGIEQTLRDLDIPTDATPAQAAQEAAAAVAQSGSDEEEIDITDEALVDQQQAGALVDDDLGGDEEEEEESGGIIAPFPTLLRPPKLDTAVVPNPTASRGGRPKKNEKPRGVQMSKSITDKVPGAEKVMVYQRRDGKRWFVQEYSKDDLSTYANFESFLTRYVMPKHGPGEYDLVGVDGRGNNHELGQVRLLGDNSVVQSPENNVIGLVEKLMKDQRERDEKFLQRQASGNMDPLQLLAGVMNLKKEMEAETGGGMSSVFTKMLDTSKESGNTMLTLMMAMMQQSQQQMTTMMTLLMQPREDPITKVLLTKLLSDGGLGGGGGAAMPPPPPPPPQMNMAEMLTALGTFIGPFVGGGGGGDEEYKEMLKTLVLQSQAEKLGIKDLLGIVQQLKGEGGSGGTGFKDTIDNLAAVMNIAQNIARQNEPGASAGLWDALASLFSNRDFAGSIAQAVRLKMDAKAGTVEQRLQAEGQRILMERRLLEQEKARLLAAGGTLPQGVTPLHQGAQPVQQTAANGQPTGEHVPQTSAPRQNTGKPRATQAQIEEAAQREVQRTGKVPELPPQTDEHINNIITAKDDAERVGKTVGLLMYFAEYEDWKPFCERILMLIRDGNRGEAMKWFSALFEGLTELGVYDARNIPPLLEVLNEHFVTVQDQIAEFVSAAEQTAPITGTELSQPPPPQVEAPAAE